MNDPIEQVKAALATLNGADDNLCRALYVLGRARSVTIIPQPDHITPKPVIIVPQRLYNRLMEMVEAEKENSHE